MRHPLTFLAVGLLSAATLAFELTLTRLFALAQFYHFAFMVISLALLGTAASGSLLSAWPRLGRCLDAWAAGFGAAALIGYAILNWVPFDSYAIAWDRRQAAALLLTLLGATAPFLCSGMVIGSLLAHDTGGLHRVYAANLAGSALGCVLALALLGWLGGEGALFASAALGFGAAVMFAFPHPWPPHRTLPPLPSDPTQTSSQARPGRGVARGRGGLGVREHMGLDQQDPLERGDFNPRLGSTLRPEKDKPAGSGLPLEAPFRGLGFSSPAIDGRALVAVLSTLALAATLALALIRPPWAALRLSPYKSLSQALLAPGAQHALSQWTVTARVDVVRSDSIHLLPGLSQNTRVAQPPPQSGLTLDGDNLQPLTALVPEDDLARALGESVPLAVIGALRPDHRSVLVLEPGGGWDALMLLASGSPAVTVVERNAAVIGILRGEEARGLYADPRLTVIHAEGRSYLSRTAETFDAIDLALSDSFHPVTSGAYSLSEDYRVTVEAVGGALDHLNPGGMLIVTRWLQTPPTEPLRTLATVEAALRARGAERPADHLAAFRSLRTITFVVMGEPLTEADQAVIRAFADSRGYDLVWLPTITPDETNRHIRLPEDVFYTSFAALLTDPATFIRGYEYDIRPATDDRPFFFHYFRWRQTPAVIAALGHTFQPFGGSGYLVLVALLIVVALLAALLIVAPLLLRRSTDGRVDAPRGTRARALVYFSMLGLGFLFIEIPLAQRMILFLGQPVTALAVVLFAVLLFSGVGSLTAPRWRLGVALAALIGLAMLMPLILRGLSALALGWPLPLRIAAAVAALAPLGLLMGVPFARGLALVERILPGLTPWAWAVNGGASVISAVLAVMIAMGWGFSAVLWLGAGAYGVALAAMRTLGKRP